ncbi:MAG TPA: phosphopantetheine-binding protein [Blastocatellia bacterium]|nr:phosphopantetheine-binding protein [Blastocatellia bacterium]
MADSVTADKVKTKMAGLLRQPVERLRDDAVLTDLVSQSLLLIEMVIELQEEFAVRLVQDDLKDVKTVGDLTRLIERKAK